jgi:TRAP-type C4-dicarboxylate transport system permease small subunit
MKNIDIVAIIFIAFGVYCAIGLKKDYAEYKKTKHYIDYKIYIRNIAVVVGAVFMFFYELSRLFSYLRNEY